MVHQHIPILLLASVSRLKPKSIGLFLSLPNSSFPFHLSSRLLLFMKLPISSRRSECRAGCHQSASRRYMLFKATSPGLKASEREREKGVRTRQRKRTGCTDSDEGETRRKIRERDYGNDEDPLCKDSPFPRPPNNARQRPQAASGGHTCGAERDERSLNDASSSDPLP